MTNELKAAVALLFDVTFEIHPEDIDFTQFLKLLKSNKVPLATLGQNKFFNELLQNKDFSDAIAREQSLYSFSLAEYKSVFKVWQREGINAVLIKSSGAFPYTSDNVDVLVHPDQSDRAKKLLVQNGFVELPHIREPFKDLFRRFSSPENSFAIHVHTAVGWINTFFSAEEILSHCRQSSSCPEVFYPSLEHSFLINTAHWFYEDKEMKLRDFCNAVVCTSQPLNWELIRQEVHRKGWEDGLNMAMMVYSQTARRLLNRVFVEPNILENFHSSLSTFQRRHTDGLQNREINFPFRLSKLLCKLYHYKKSYDDRIIGIGAKLKDMWLLSRFMVQVKVYPYMRQRAMLVTLSGVDYSGKTTLAKNLREMLNISAVPTRYHWIRVGSSKFLEVLKKPYKEKSMQTESTNGARAKLSVRVFKGNPTIKNIWVLILAVDVVVRTWFFVMYEKIRGGVLIFDRFIYDHLIDLIADYNINGIIKKIVEIILRCSPRSSFAIWLDGEKFEVIRRVKQESEKRLIEDRIALYKAIKDEKFRTFDISLSPSDLSRQIYTAILKYYFSKRSIG